MTLLVTGAGGLVGKAVCGWARARGWGVVRLRRGTGPAAGEATWDTVSGRMDFSKAGPLDAVIHLAGETIAQRWTDASRQRIRDSRVLGTQALAAALERLPSPPSTVICASATGYYGDRGDQWVDETSGAGDGFLANVCREWEAAALGMLPGKARVVCLRFGIVLTPDGGALAKMLPAFKLGVAGKLGNGLQYWSWITLDDLLRVLEHVLAEAKLSGPVNATSPNPVTNAEFTRTLGEVLHRPTVLAMPRFAVNLLFGEMGRAALLSGVRVKPARLIESGFQFGDATLKAALARLLGRTS